MRKIGRTGILNRLDAVQKQWEAFAQLKLESLSTEKEQGAAEALLTASAMIKELITLVEPPVEAVSIVPPAIIIQKSIEES